MLRMPPAASPAIADDSGLCVDALGGAPGVAVGLLRHTVCACTIVSSAAQRSDADNNAVLLEQMRHKADRRALRQHAGGGAQSADDPEPLIAMGRWAVGTAARATQGDGGFGYDPVLFDAPDLAMPAWPN